MQLEEEFSRRVTLGTDPFKQRPTRIPEARRVSLVPFLYDVSRESGGRV